MLAGSSSDRSIGCVVSQTINSCRHWMALPRMGGLLLQSANVDFKQSEPKSTASSRGTGQVSSVPLPDAAASKSTLCIPPVSTEHDAKQRNNAHQPLANMSSVLSSCRLIANQTVTYLLHSDLIVIVRRRCKPTGTSRTFCGHVPSPHKKMI